ncbi:carboxypeptidase-like regulatory domain-containing protein [Aquimarina sp. 2201CG14-23]|uniref:carboxypeptidase-like regulatory domain-containing protein n=1 Tax=Aquimarina mycalae TaxID=3040073 RepID=UPI002477DBFC|nr:carboxypeptidase-like regulatory domain-containing protein [Aquimarina sp. 2201CG14-23]MDH7444956.1 carboxypeptidase-like regulatory domain-containing protein [Aquimarina sp. 2201CG14-23]
MILKRLLFKKRNTIFYILAILCASSFSFSQTSPLKGLVVDANTNQPFSYANINVPNKNIGCITKADGSFVLDPKNAQENDSIVFSYIGYESKSFTLKSLKKFLNSNTAIGLQENIEELDETVIISKTRWKIKTLGSQTTSSLGYGFSADVGSELGRKIKIQKKNTHLLKFGAHVVTNTYESIKLRLNIYALRDGGLGEKINTENIYVDFKDTSGFLEIDLEPYNIVVSENIIITLQWVDYTGSGDFKVSSKLPGLSKTILKSFGYTMKFPITLGYHVKVKY